MHMFYCFIFSAYIRFVVTVLIKTIVNETNELDFLMFIEVLES